MTAFVVKKINLERETLEYRIMKLGLAKIFDTKAHVTEVYDEPKFSNHHWWVEVQYSLFYTIGYCKIGFIDIKEAKKVKNGYEINPPIT